MSVNQLFIIKNLLTPRWIAGVIGLITYVTLTYLSNTHKLNIIARKFKQYSTITRRLSAIGFAILVFVITNTSLNTMYLYASRDQFDYNSFNNYSDTEKYSINDIAGV